jgi:myo-inositol-1(or 4)-monophosphatase
MPAFVVDPIDGTRGFIDGNRDWAVSVAVIKGGNTIAAALCVPAKERLFAAVLGGGAFLNGARLDCPPAVQPLIFAGSRRLDHEMQRLGLPVIAHVPSLACRIAMVATGEIGVVLARQGSHVWDVAAAALILKEAGGALVNPDGSPLRTTLLPPATPAFIAARLNLMPEALRLAKEHSFLQ